MSNNPIPLDGTAIIHFNNQLTLANELLGHNIESYSELAHYVVDNAINKLSMEVGKKNNISIQAKGGRTLDFPQLWDILLMVYPILSQYKSEVLNQHGKRNFFQHNYESVQYAIRRIDCERYVQLLESILHNLNILRNSSHQDQDEQLQEGETSECLILVSITGEEGKEMLNELDQIVREREDGASISAKMLTGKDLEIITQVSSMLSNVKSTDLNGIGDSKLFSDTAKLLTDLKKDEEAIIYLRAALMKTPGNAKILSNLSQSLRHINDTKGAVDASKEAIKIAPNDSRVCCEYGVALLEAGDIKTAIKVLRKAISIDKTNTDAWCVLGSAYKVNDNKWLASKAFSKGLKSGGYLHVTKGEHGHFNVPRRLVDPDQND